MFAFAIGAGMRNRSGAYSFKPVCVCRVAYKGGRLGFQASPWNAFRKETYILSTSQCYERGISFRNIIIEQSGLAVTVSTIIRKVLGSNLGTDTSYTDWRLS
jgi:hypothetical protein